MKIIWQPVTRLRHANLSRKLRELLADPASLTSHLQRYCPLGPRIKVKSQSWRRPLPDEIRSLKLGGGAHAFVREIFLTCENRPWIYGRSIIPATTVSGNERRLLSWGNKSLGDYLFKSRNSFRGEIEIAQIPPQSRLYKLCGCAADEQGLLWGRRSIFYIKGKSLLVIEILLPDIYRCLT